MAGRRLTVAAKLGLRCALLGFLLSASAALTGCLVEVGQPGDEDTSIYESELGEPGPVIDPIDIGSPLSDPGGESGEPEPTPWRATSDDSTSGPTPPPNTKTVNPAPKGGADEQ